MTQADKKLRLGEALVEEGVISQEQLDRALGEQKATGQKLGEMLVEHGLITGADMLRILGRNLGLQSCHLRHGLIDPTLLKLIGEEEAERLAAIPMFKVHDTLTVAMSEPQSLPKIDRLRQLTGCKIR
ncbi:MAG: type II secretion system protein GspE, partial [Phycisphaerae bacterium]|nr:type II secretion system protein GspE [Phycisphaerae bacterium]